MSSSEQIYDLYEEVNSQFMLPTFFNQKGYAPIVHIKGKSLDSKYLNDLIQSCVKLYNKIDSVIETLRLTVPMIYKELEKLIVSKITGDLLPSKPACVVFREPQSMSQYGNLFIPSSDELPHGIKPVISFLTKAFENLDMNRNIVVDEYYYTARVIFGSLKASLTHLLTRFDYVMMFPHRIVLDRAILETGLKKHGFDRVVAYIQAVEESFNKQKYVEFCAMARNALHEAVKNVCLIVEGDESGFSNNCKRLDETGFMKGTIIKQMKEFSGSLSACGSHPPRDELSPEEAKFLLDSLYGFLGLISLRLSSFKNIKSRAQAETE